MNYAMPLCDVPILVSLSFREGIRFAGQVILFRTRSKWSRVLLRGFGARTALAGCAVRNISPGFSLTLPSIYHQLKRTGDQPRRLLPVVLGYLLFST